MGRPNAIGVEKLMNFTKDLPALFKLSKLVLQRNFEYFYKAVVAGPAGPASAGPLFWPTMISAVSLFSLQLLRPCLSVI